MVYAILADDLTGAADAGAEFAQAGWRTRVLRHDWQAADMRGAEVVAVDTASRTCTAAAAYAAVRQAAERLQKAGAVIIYKKIDSTLRGPVGADLDAVLDACGLRAAIVCPAFPAQSRTLINGVLQVAGVPVSQTAIGRDPVSPIGESFLPALLARQTRRPVHHLPHLSTGAGAEAPAAQWRTLLAQGGLLVVDAGNEQDLAQIIRAVQGVSESLLLAGSSGLARPLAARLAHVRQRQVLVVCGSLHPAARTQVHTLRQHHLSSRVTLLATPEDRSAGAAPQQAVQALAQTTAGWLAGHDAAAVVVIGGDTLEALLAALGAGGLDLEQALAPGIAFGRVAGGPWAGLRIASKAGGFGEANMLVQIVSYLSGAEQA